MVMIEEILECERCHAHKSHAVDNDQIGPLAGGGAVEFYCPTCQGQTPWHYPTAQSGACPVGTPTDPLLETFQRPGPVTAEHVDADPLLVDYDGLELQGRKERSSWEWYG